jgi:hypothetical protein
MKGKMGVNCMGLRLGQTFEAKLHAWSALENLRWLPLLDFTILERTFVTVIERTHLSIAPRALQKNYKNGRRSLRQQKTKDIFI